MANETNCEIWIGNQIDKSVGEVCHYEKFEKYNEAKKYLIGKCKENSRIHGKFLYSEYEACITNNKVEEFYRYCAYQMIF